jgi:ferric-dicitrate binding protein FerR (iron transport regulator)
VTHNDSPHSSELPSGERGRDSALAPLIDRYLAGQATAAETAELERATSTDIALSNDLQLLRAFVERPGGTQSQPDDVERALHSIAKRRTGAHSAPSQAPVPEASYPRFSRNRFDVPSARQRGVWTRIAALVGCLVAGVGVMRWADVVERLSPVSRGVYRTAAAERRVITLSDRTRMILAPFTTARVDGETIVLEGEALFDVTARPSHPLIIRTAGVTTRVLGTVFSVRRYPDEPETRVVVSEGRVSTGESRQVTVSAGMVARVTDSSVVTTTTDVTPYTSWTRGVLVFRGTPVREAVLTIGRWYGVRFRVTDSLLAGERITATFDYASSREAIAALRHLLDITTAYDSTDATLIILRPLPAPRASQRRERELESTSPREVGK